MTILFTFGPMGPSAPGMPIEKKMKMQLLMRSKFQLLLLKRMPPSKAANYPSEQFCVVLVDKKVRLMIKELFLLPCR